MIGSAAAWRRMVRVWLPGLLLLLLNLAVLSTYRILLAGQTQISASRVERLSGNLEELEDYRQALEDVIGRAETNRGRMDEFYSGWLSSEADRLTQVIGEVKSMARRAGVRTSGFRYPDEVIEKVDLVRRNIEFSAEGSYKAMRQFIHALERSDQFLILETIGVSESGEEIQEIRVRFGVSTLFLSAAQPRGEQA